MRNLRGAWRYAALCLRYPQLRRRRFFVASGVEMRVDRGARIRMGRHVRFMRDFTGHFSGQVTIGDDVYFNRGCHVVALNRLEIGDHCLFGEGVSIHDENHCLGSDSLSRAACGFTTSPIRIGRNVWVGAKASILQGVSIGDNAVIGAGAVVTRDVPARTLALGIPARVVRSL